MVETTSEGSTTGISADPIDGIEKNHNHPLYLHPSYTPGSVLTSVQLTGTENYSLWSRSMMINLRAKSNLGFVLGTCRKSDYKPDLEEQWEKCNAFLLAWIMNTVSNELLSGIMYASDAVMVWGDLNKRFNKVDGSRSYQLHRDICTLSQGNLTVSRYFTKLRLLWDEFDALVPPPSCSYDKSRSQILMMNPIPSVSKAYAMIAADESQRVTAGSRINSDLNDSMTLYAERGKCVHHSNESMALYVGRGGYTNAGAGNNYNNPNPRQKKNWHLFCDYCKLHGYTKDICFQLIGYPADWKFKKKFGPGGSSSGTGNVGRGMANHAYADRDIRDDFGFMNHGSVHPGQELPSGDVLSNVLDLFNGKVKGTGKERDGLYYFPRHLLERVKHVEQSLLTQAEKLEGITWHNRIGHPSVKVLKFFIYLEMLTPNFGPPQYRLIIELL
ncbi:hypothetical protein KY290_007665 [Solanum tuberosum]|uniref:Retrotransposon Copia-like N-terminal domain-containing protein n=1 Tax=Solanum tuberosum TaxID=4113 RepID=A0ABQ7W684_SOLTU|nr:hypothetical protein KY290_007665 [Solanum tuberosum]